jgi:hypothetical protein
MTETFQERYCRHFKLPADRYETSMFRRALYPRVRWCRGLIWIFDRGFFSADREFVRGVGQLVRARDFHAELKDFQFHPDNRGFLRGGLRLRISANRMARMFFAIWGETDALPPAALNPSESPFAAPGTDVSAPTGAMRKPNG